MSLRRHRRLPHTSLSSLRSHRRSLRCHLTSLRSHRMKPHSSCLRSHRMQLQTRFTSPRSHRTLPQTSLRSIRLNSISLRSHRRSLQSHLRNLRSHRRSLRSHLHFPPNSVHRIALCYPHPPLYCLCFIFVDFDFCGVKLLFAKQLIQQLILTLPFSSELLTDPAEMMNE